MVRLVDAAGNNVTDYRADQPWEVLISAAAEGGEDLIKAQPDLCTDTGTGMISIKYVDFAGRLIAPYLLVDENEDEKFFHYLPDSAALATPWSELRAGMTDWSQTSPSTFQERLDGVFAKADKTQFEWKTGFIDTAGTDKPPGLTTGSDWPAPLRWIAELRCDQAFGIIGVDENEARPGQVAADLFQYMGTITKPEADFAKGKHAYRLAALATSLFQSDTDPNVCDGAILAHDIASGLKAHRWTKAFTITIKPNMEAIEDLRARVEFGKASMGEVAGPAALRAVTARLPHVLALVPGPCPTLRELARGEPNGAVIVRTLRHIQTVCKLPSQGLLDESALGQIDGCIQNYNNYIESLERWYGDCTVSQH